jgi:LPXTG-motif cell wall-anchored protein
MHIRRALIALSIGALTVLGLAVYGGVASAHEPATNDPRPCAVQEQSGFSCKPHKPSMTPSQKPSKTPSKSPKASPTKSKRPTPPALPTTGSDAPVPVFVATGAGLILVGGVLVGLRRRRRTFVS